MIETNNFKTKTIFLSRKNETVTNYNQIALDIGYSSTKGFGPRMVFCFPSFVKKLNAGGLLSLSVPSPDDILYKDLITNEIWAVGKLAIDLISPDEANISTTELYGRNRYSSSQFLIPAKVGMAFALLGANNNAPVHLQTGLPPKYINDAKDLKENLAGHYDFAIKQGTKPWTEFHFDLDSENIDIMPQPKGTLFSLIYDNMGHKSANANSILNSRLLIADGGFGTFDLFNINNIEIDGYETLTEFGMEKVLEATANEISKKYDGIELPVPVMQQNLKTGTFRYYKRENGKMVTKDEPFGDILEECSNKICDEAIAKMCSLYKDMIYHNYLVITGGTGEAWFTRINSYFSTVQTLNCVKGTQNDTLPSIFSNVRGYYMFQLNLLRRRK